MLIHIELNTSVKVQVYISVYSCEVIVVKVKLPLFGGQTDGKALFANIIYPN